MRKLSLTQHSHYRGENSILKRNLQQITRGQLADILEDSKHCPSDPALQISKY